MTPALAEMGLIEMKFPRLDRSAGKQPVHGAKSCSVAARYAVSGAANRNVRMELSLFARKACSRQSGRDFRLEMDKLWRRRNAYPQRMGLAIAKETAARKLELEVRRANVPESRVYFCKTVAVSIANELQRQMKVVFWQPANPLNAVLQLGNRVLNDFGQGKGGEKPMHASYV